MFKKCLLLLLLYNEFFITLEKGDGEDELHEVYVDEVKWVLLNVATNNIPNFRYRIQTEQNREKGASLNVGQKNHSSGYGRKGDTTEALENLNNGFWQLKEGATFQLPPSHFGGTQN